MKKSYLIPVMALLLGACANDSFTPGQNPEEEGNVRRSYLSVSLYSSAGVRAGDEDEVYVNGEEEENKINTVRFFFFTESNTACDVFKQTVTGQYLSYIDWTPYDSDIKPGNPNITVSKIAQATLGINQPAEALPPAKVIAVINPTPDVLALKNPSLSELTGLIGDYYTGLHNENFLMTNSVYADGNGNSMNKIDATLISEDNLAATEEEFNSNDTGSSKKALNIFVERVLARVDFSLNLNEEYNPSKEIIEENGNKFPIYKVSDPKVNGESKDVYVKLLGWNITTTANTSRLVKEINSAWVDDNMFGVNMPWNVAAYHRSFWAVNPEEVLYSFGSFNPDSKEQGNTNPALGYQIPSNGVANAYKTVYVQENAADYFIGQNGFLPDGPANPTKIIIGAQLVDESGSPLPLAYWANRYYLQNDLLEAVANVLNLYQETAPGQFDQIMPKYLKFENSLGDGLELPKGEDPKGYYAYVQLKPTPENETPVQWYEGPSSEKKLTTQQVNEYILNRVNYVMVWQEGNTYYYFDIKHLGADNENEDGAGKVGIVRNHLYKANLTSIEGLGTPVFDPDQVIYPEVPEHDDNVLRVDVNVLQWRIVSEDYDIVWP